MYQDFQPALILGQANEQVIADEFARRGIPIIRTEGKNDYDMFLPDGRSVEIKLDLRSQTTPYAAIEEPTMRKNPDFLIQTLCYAVVLDRPTREFLYPRGKITHMGAQQYDGRLINKVEMKRLYLDQFIKSLQN